LFARKRLGERQAWLGKKKKKKKKQTKQKNEKKFFRAEKRR